VGIYDPFGRLKVKGRREESMGSVSFWQAEQDARAPAALAPAPLREHHTADVVVIGAGITGCSAALWLARAGARVVVLEGREVAASASGRNGGFLLGGTAETYATSIVHYGRERARRSWAFSLENHALAAQLIEEMGFHGWDVGYHRSGSIRIATSETEMENIWKSVRLLLEDGWEATQIDRTELPERIRSAYLGGSFHPMDGEMQPVAFVRGLAQLAAADGAQFHTHSPVTSLTEHSDHVRVATPEGAVEAEMAVLAANAHLPALLSQIGTEWLGAAIQPTRGQVLATSPLDTELFAWPCYADEGYQYWRQLADGRLVIGGWRNRSFETEYSDDETPCEPVQAHLERFLREGLGIHEHEAAVEHRWAGTMAFSRDGMPLVGRVPTSSRCFVAGGYTGHGNAYAVASATVVAELVRHGSHPDADLFDPGRFTPAR
jgi:gamma-glutamylputrescine oxidase